MANSVDILVGDGYAVTITEREVIRKEMELQQDDPRHGMQSAVEALIDKRGIADAVRQELENGS